jgi:sterol desaturase/sphingolipid hydroxylase (fatty acid hydroxylase superfamily)
MSFFENDMYCGWFAYWITYWTLAWFMPKYPSITRPKDKMTQWKVLRSLLSNMVFTFCMLPIYNWAQPQLSWRTSEGWNSNLVFGITYGDLAAYGGMWIIFETANYHIHGILLHQTPLKRFHEDHHSFITSKPPSAIYVSIVEMIIESPFHSMPIYRLLCYQTWEIIAISIIFAIYGLRTHSGVTQNVPPTTVWNKFILFLWDDSYHAVHHKNRTKNLGSSWIFDWLYGTYADPKKVFENVKYGLQTQSGHGNYFL